VGIPKERITAFSSFGFAYSRRLYQSQSASDRTAAYLWGGSRFCERIISRGLPDCDGVYTFSCGGLELMAFARHRGKLTAYDQLLPPREVEECLQREEQARFPDWEKPWPEDEHLEALKERERQEWANTDVIICPSQYVYDEIRNCGGPVERCVIVPPGGVDDRFNIPERAAHNGPLRVLTIGRVDLRKGSPYVLEAAKLLGKGVHFRMVGGIGVSDQAAVLLRSHVELLGPVPHANIREQFAWADVFLLPSVCEGSAGVVYEALASGLPVITTPNAGSVVRDGEDGFLIPIRDGVAIASRLDRLASQSKLRHRMAGKALERGREFTLPRYGERLIAALERKNGTDGFADR
jgi:glycosyltransferase involved in cell wall biosynthesis